MPLVDERGSGTITAFSTAPGSHALACVLQMPDGYHLRVADRTGANRCELHRSSQQLMNLSWSPDGARLAFYRARLRARRPAASTPCRARAGRASPWPPTIAPARRPSPSCPSPDRRRATSSWCRPWAGRPRAASRGCWWWAGASSACCPHPTASGWLVAAPGRQRLPAARTVWRPDRAGEDGLGAG